MSATPETIHDESIPAAAPAARVKVLQHIADELALMTNHRDLELAAAAMEIRHDVDRKLIDARRAATAA